MNIVLERGEVKKKTSSERELEEIRRIDQRTEKEVGVESKEKGIHKLTSSGK